ncbi:MAG: hypothetical protein U9Q07_04140 [Planctomycetota bacterium]|nr:hypothetical protein [Planctomycetota bacterium]
MRNNPEWKPFIEAVERVSDTLDIEHVANDNFGHLGFLVVLPQFLASYPPRLRPVVALALSLAKWYLIAVEGCGIWQGESTGGCCCFHRVGNYWTGGDRWGGCSGCPLDDSVDGIGCIEGTNAEIYTRIHRIYTEHFNALPARDRQVRMTPTERKKL